MGMPVLGGEGYRKGDGLEHPTAVVFSDMSACLYSLWLTSVDD